MATMPRVLLDLRPLQSGYAGHGIGRYTRELTQALLALRKKRGLGRDLEMQALLFSHPQYPPWKPETVLAGFEGLEAGLFCPPWKRTWLWDQTHLGGFWLKTGKWDLLHQFVSLGPLGISSLPWLSAGMCVATVHDLHLFSPDAPPVLKAYRQTRRMRCQEWALPRSNAVLVDAAPIQEQLLRRFPVASPPIILPPGGDHLLRRSKASRPHFSPEGDGAPSPLPPLSYVLAIGDTPNKGLGFAAEIVAMARKRGDDLQLLVLGDAENVKRELGPWNGQPFIHIQTRPDDDGLIRAYTHALALVFPSDREGFGLPILEAQSLGCPALTADIRPMKDLVAQPEHCLALSDAQAWAQALLRLRQAPEWRRTCVEAGKTLAAEFTWERTASALIEIWANRMGVGN